MQDQLFIAKIPTDYPNEQIIALFETVGKVKKIYRPTKRETGQPETYAFITMESPEAGQAAIERLNGHSLGEGSLPLVVKVADERAPVDNLFVAKIPSEFSNDQLRELFAAVGEIKQFYRPTRRETGMPETYAFIRMASQELAQDAIERLDGYSFGADAHPLVVKRAEQKTEPPVHQPNTRLYITPLPDGISDDELKTLFETVGEVSTVVHPVRGKDKQPAKFAFVTMATSELAQEAITRLNGHSFDESQEPLTVKLADEHPASGEGRKKGPAKERPQEAVAKQLADALGETEKMPRQLVKNIVYKCGIEQAQAWYEQTMEIEANGGMMMEKLGRKRTPGGVFFFLAKKSMPPEMVVQIFPREAAWHKKKLERQANGTPAAPPPPSEPEDPPFLWEQRANIAQELLEESGNTLNVKVVVVGRPDSVNIDTNQVTLIIKRNFQLTHVPRGVPRPPAFPTTTTVYVPLKMWNKVEEALKDPEDRLVIEGFAAIEPGKSGYSVYGTMVTTAVLQRARFAKPDSPQQS